MPHANSAMQVISTSGDTHLGGEDFDHRVMDYFIKLIKKKYKTDISKDGRALQKLRREAERAKRALSSQHQVTNALSACTPLQLADANVSMMSAADAGHARYTPCLHVMACCCEHLHCLHPVLKP